MKQMKQEEGLEGILGDVWEPSDPVEKERLELDREKWAAQQDTNIVLQKEMKQLAEGIQGLIQQMATKDSGPSRSYQSPQSSNVSGSNRYGNNNSNTYGNGNRERPSNAGNSSNPSGMREFLCFMCRAKDHLMQECPHYQDFLKRGWLIPEGNGSNRVKLRDEKLMPRDNPQKPRYKQIEEMAEALGWNKAESYFANMEDDDDLAEMDYQLEPENSESVSVWMNRMESLVRQLGEQRLNVDEGERSVSSFNNGKRKN
jgi:hypothetical protein